jgi:hypothetical protein
MHYVLIAQDRHSIARFSRRQTNDSWNLSECHDAVGNIELSAIDCQLSAAEVYDKVIFENVA